jgi:hypothetical protein
LSRLAITYQIAQIVTTGVPDNLIGMVVDNTPDRLLKFCFADLVKSLSQTPAYQCLLIVALFTQFASTKAIAYINQTTEEITSSYLQHLINLYLLFPQKTEQYSLHSLTQEYLQLELNQQPDYEAKIRDRQVQYYLKLVEPYSYLSSEEWHDYQELQVEWVNLRSLVEWCIISDRYPDVKSFWYGLKAFTRTLGYWRERKLWLDWLVDAAILKQDWQMVAEAKFHQSQTLAYMDESDASGQAMKLAEEAWNLQKYCAVDWQLDLSLYIATLYIRQPKPDRWKIAQTWCDRSHNLFQNLPVTIPTYLEKQCRLCYSQAEIYAKYQQFEAALDTYQQGLEIAENINHKKGITYLRARISLILIHQNKFSEAQEELISLLDLTNQYHDKRSQSFCYQYLAIVSQQLQILEDARCYANLAQESFTNLGMEAAASEMDRFLQSI